MAVPADDNTLPPDPPHVGGDLPYLRYRVRPRPRLTRHIVLFLLTLVTTTMVGAGHYASFLVDFGARLPALTTMQLVLNGLWFSATILGILGCHEFGHYFACRYYGVDASLPYFIPAPPFFLFGTFGAVIRIRQRIPSKRMIFDIGIAGPIAGFVVAVPALLVGIYLSRVVRVPPDFQGLALGEPLLFKAAAYLLRGPIAEPYSLNLHPMAFAAWFGLLATALNLFPIGQLDGGHIAYAVLGRRSTLVTAAMVAGLVGLTFFSLSWLVWTVVTVGMLLTFGLRHPSTDDEDVPLDRGRLWLALAALVIFIVCFTPTPIEPLDLVGGR